MVTVRPAGGDDPTIVSVTLADLLVSVTEVAVRVTAPLPAGTAEGAVYALPKLENAPQADDPQEAVQVTPALRESLTTV
jgi:hypothetical protein